MLLHHRKSIIMKLLFLVRIHRIISIPTLANMKAIVSLDSWHGRETSKTLPPSTPSHSPLPPYLRGSITHPKKELVHTIKQRRHLQNIFPCKYIFQKIQAEITNNTSINPETHVPCLSFLKVKRAICQSQDTHNRGEI